MPRRKKIHEIDEEMQKKTFDSLRMHRKRRRKYPPKVKDAYRSLSVDTKRKAKKVYLVPPPRWNPKKSDVKGVDYPSQETQMRAAMLREMMRTIPKDLAGKKLTRDLRFFLKYAPRSRAGTAAFAWERGGKYYIALRIGARTLKQEERPFTESRRKFIRHELGHHIWKDLKHVDGGQLDFWVERQSDALKRAEKRGLRVDYRGRLAVDAQKLYQFSGKSSIWDLVKASFTKKAKALRVPSFYGLVGSYQEYFCECYAYYRLFPSQFKKFFPKEYAWFEKYLAYLKKKEVLELEVRTLGVKAFYRGSKIYRVMPYARTAYKVEVSLLSERRAARTKPFRLIGVYRNFNEALKAMNIHYKKGRILPSTIKDSIQEARSVKIKTKTKKVKKKVQCRPKKYTKKGTIRKFYCRKCKKVHLVTSKTGKAHWKHKLGK